MPPQPSGPPAARELTRRSVLSMLAASAGAFALGACGSGDQPAGPLGFSSDFSGARLRAIMRDANFADLNQVIVEHSATWSERVNATIDLEFSPDWRERYTESARDRLGADLAELFGRGPHLLGDSLADVSELAERIGDANGGWIQVARDAAQVDGVWRAVPWSYTAHAINYREDLLAQVSMEAPATYDDVLEAATRLNDAGLPRAGFTMNTSGPNDSANFAYSMLWSFGGRETDDSGTRVVLDSAGTRAALRHFRELVQVSNPRSLTFDELENNLAFLAGEISMTQNASSIYRVAFTEHPDIAQNMNHIRYPSGPEGRHQLVEINSLGLFRHSQSADAARSWIDAVTQGELLRDRAQRSLTFFSPLLTDLLADPDIPLNANPKFQGLGGIGPEAHLAGWPGHNSVEAALVYENASIVKMFAAVGSGSATVREAVAAATEELRRVYET